MCVPMSYHSEQRMAVVPAIRSKTGLHIRVRVIYIMSLQQANAIQTEILEEVGEQERERR